jgi:hypothetical protein
VRDERSGVRFLAEEKIFFSPKRPDRLWSPTSLLLNGYRGSFYTVKRPGREVDYSPPSSTVVKNEWCYTSTSPTCFHVVDRDSFTFTILPDIIVFFYSKCNLYS